MADMHIKHGGSWAAIANCEIKQGGSWTQVNKIYVKDSGSWKQVWSNYVYSLSNLASSYTDLGTITDSYSVSLIARESITDGSIDILRAINSGSPDEEQMITPAGGTLYIKATYVSGDVFTAGTVGSWLELNVDRTWTMSHTSGGGVDFISGVYKFELATDSGGSNIVADSGNITFQAGETA